MTVDELTKAKSRIADAEKLYDRLKVVEEMVDALERPNVMVAIHVLAPYTNDYRTENRGALTTARDDHNECLTSDVGLLKNMATIAVKGELARLKKQIADC